MALTLRLNDEQDATLTALAAAEHRSKNEVVLLAIAERAERADRHSRVMNAFDYVIKRDASLLERLADA